MADDSAREKTVKRIAYIADSPDWIQAQRAKDLQPYLPEHELHILLPSFASLSGPWDAVWVASWRILLAHPGIIDRLPTNRTLLGVTSHYNLGGGLKPETCFRVGADPAEEFAKAIEILGRFPVLTCNSRILFEMLVPRLPMTEVILAQNGVDAEFFHPRIQPPSDEGHIAVSWVGKDKGLKNLAAYMDAYRQLDGGKYRFQLIVPKKRGGLVKDRYGMRQFYWMTDFLVCTSFAEGTPNPALEAAACGVPLITTKVGNMPELVSEGNTGWFIDQTAESLIACVERLQHVEPHEYRSMSQAVRTEIEAHWTWPKRAVAYRKALETLCEQ